MALDNSPITVTKPFLPDKKEFDKLTDEIWKNRWLTNDGPLLQRFIQGLKEFTGAEHVCPTVNGHLGLDIAMKVLELKGEVITTPFSFASTSHAISMNGCKPVFCDIREDDYTLDADLIEDLITDKTSAIMPVHVYGFPCNVDKIERIAKKHGLSVIYDAAHAFGVRYNKKSLVRYGDLSMVSFHATKLFNTIEGGALITDRDDLEGRIRALRNFGIVDEVNVDYIAGNAKMNEFQAAMGILNLQSIDDILKERKAITEHYRERLEGIDGITFHVPENDSRLTYNYAYFPVLIDKEEFGKDREHVYQYLKDRRIYTRRYFYPLISDYACYSGLEHRELPNAERISEQVLCLPIYNGLTIPEVDLVVDTILGSR